MQRYYVLTLAFKMGDTTIEVHPVLIREGNDLILCDAGYPNQMDQIEAELAKYGYLVKDLTKVFITHHDHDHVGSLALLKQKNPMLKILSSELEAPYINGTQKSLRLIQAEAYNQTLPDEGRVFGEQFVNYLKTISSAPVDEIVSDKDYIAEGVRVIATPGHTPGHSSLMLEDENILIVGDALAYENHELTIANPEFTLDLDGCEQSIQKIRQMKFQKLICYHGGIVEGHFGE